MRSVKYGKTVPTSFISCSKCAVKAYACLAGESDIGSAGVAFKSETYVHGNQTLPKQSDIAVGISLGPRSSPNASSTMKEC